MLEPLAGLEVKCPKVSREPECRVVTSSTMGPTGVRVETSDQYYLSKEREVPVLFYTPSRDISITT